MLTSRPPAGRAGTVRKSRTRCRSSMGVAGPVLDSPLALCDAASFTDADLVPSDLVYRDRVGEITSVRFNPTHRWYYFSRMQRDEALLIKCHDSASDDRARLSFHTAFKDPT